MTSEHIEQLLKIPAIAYLESTSGNLYEYIGNGIFSDINDSFPVCVSIEELQKIPDSFFWFKNEINNNVMEGKTMTVNEKRELITNKIINYFEENEELFNQVLEELDSWNGYLNDDRVIPMDELNEYFSGREPIDILYRAFYGHDDETYHTDEHGEKHYGEFNPNRDFFYFNGYGNLVSCDCKDYSGYLDSYFVESLINNYSHLYTNDFPVELDELIEEYENIEDDETETEGK